VKTKAKPKPVDCDDVLDRLYELARDIHRMDQANAEQLMEDLEALHCVIVLDPDDERTKYRPHLRDKAVTLTLCDSDFLHGMRVMLEGTHGLVCRDDDELSKVPS
jgi:hypothetical protein